MSHSSISANRDYVHGADHGDLSNKQQSAGFVSDPMLTPISVSSMPHPVLPDPSPSDDPTLFDQSTRHPNSHYHPEAKLSKKKRAKKLGLGAVTLTNAKPGSNVGGRTFTEHDKAAHERAEGRDHALQQAHEKEEEEDEDEDEEGEEEEDDHTEEQGQSGGDKGKEEGAQGEEGQSLKEKAGGVLSGAQEKASGLLASAQEKASGMLDTVKSAPVVGSLLAKVGLGGSAAGKGEDTTKADNAQAKKEEEA